MFPETSVVEAKCRQAVLARVDYLFPRLDSEVAALPVWFRLEGVESKNSPLLCSFC